MDDWKLPGILPDNMQDYETGEWAQIAQWIESLHGTSARVYRWTWYQLFLDCIIYIFREVARGIISRAKLGDLQKRDPPRNRTKCVRWFNSFFFNERRRSYRETATGQAYASRFIGSCLLVEYFDAKNTRSFSHPWCLARCGGGDST